MKNEKSELGLLRTAAFACSVGLIAVGCGKTNVVEGTVRDEKNMPVQCRIAICKHDAGEVCNHAHEGMPCKLVKTELMAEVKNGTFRIDDVPPIDRKDLAYAAVVVTGTNALPETFFIFKDNPTLVHKSFSLPFGNKGAVVNILFRPPPPPKKVDAAAPEGGKPPADQPEPSAKKAE